MIYVVSSTSPAFAEANAQPMVMYRNLLAEGTLASSSSPTAAPRANAVTESTFDFWGVDANPSTLRATLAGATAADGAFFAAHTIGSSGGSVAIQYYDGSTWQTITTITPPDDEPFLVLWPSISAAGWGISVTGQPNIGIAWIGPRLVIPGGVLPDYVPVWAAKRVEKYPGVSRRGQWFGQRIQRSGASLTAAFMPIAHDFVLNDMSDFRDRYNGGRGFVWAAAPGVFGQDAAYCWATDDKGFAPRILAGGQLCSLSLEFEAFTA